MNRFQLTLILTLLTSYVFGQTLVITNLKGKRTKKIKIGKVMAVVDPNDSIIDPFNYYTDSTRNARSSCHKGCFRLASVNVENNSFAIAHGSTLTNYNVADVKLVSYVRAKHPYSIRGLRTAMATLGAFAVVGRTATIGNDDSSEDKLTDYLVGSEFIGASLMIRTNVPKTYRLVGMKEGKQKRSQNYDQKDNG